MDITLDGGTLQFGASFNINNNRAIILGAGGGTIDTQGFSNPGGYNATNGGFRGSGNLTKIGSGTFYAAATTGGSEASFAMGFADRARVEVAAVRGRLGRGEQAARMRRAVA